MHKELLAQSPLLALPMGAMILFLGVWVATTIRTLTRPRLEIESLARLPLDDERSPRGAAEEAS